MTTTLETTEIAHVIQQANLEKADQQSIITVLGSAFDKISDYRAQADQISIEDEFDKAGMKAARELRLLVKKTRTEGENARKKLKEDALRKGNTIDAVWRIIKNGLEPIESELEEKEKTAERIQEQRREETQKSRVSELARYNFDGSLFPLGDMTEESYSKLLETAKAGEEKRQADLLAAEQEKIEAERVAAEKAEQERIAAAKAEVERLAEVARLKAENERLEAERKAREEAERKAEEERGAIRAKAAKVAVKKLTEMGFVPSNRGMDHSVFQWVIFEPSYSQFDTKEEFDSFISDTSDRLKALEFAKSEAEKAARIEAELQEARRYVVERIAAEKAEVKKREEERKLARLAPDKDKLNKLADDLDAYVLPELSSQEAKEILSNIRVLLGKTATYARDKANTI